MDANRIKKSFVQAIFIVFMQVTYLNIFGKENSSIGMIMAMGAVSLLTRDLTGAIFYRTITFLILNLLLGLFSYISTINIYLGIVINFLSIFITTYIYINDFRTPTSYMFLMSYIFMWAKPITFDRLDVRLISISISVFIIILIQIVFNKNRFKRETNKLINKISDNIIEQVYNIKNNKFNAKGSIKINEDIRKLFNIIADRGHRKSLYKYNEVNNFNLAIYLDSLNIIINSIYKYKNVNKIIYLDDIINLINNIKHINEGIKPINEIIKDIDKFINKYKDIKNTPKFLNDILGVLNIVKMDLSIENKESKLLDKIYKTINIPTEFKLINIMKENFTINSLKLIYALKLAISVSLAMFLVQYFKLEYGRWMVITIYVITQPYEEDTVKKAKKRFVGTLIGVILFFIIFSFIKDNIPRIIILTVAFSYYFYSKDYDKKVTSMTIISLSSISLIEDLDILSLNRLILICLGIVIGLIFNKYFLPYNIEDSIEELKYKYIRNSKKIMKELSKVPKQNIDLDKLMKLFLTGSLLENRLILNNNRIKDKSLEVTIYKQSLIMSEARFILLSIYYNMHKLKKFNNSR